MSARLAALMIIRRGDGAILAVVRKSGGWGLPGGKIEPDEEPAVAAWRETREETGIRVTLACPVYTGENVAGWLAYFFKAISWSGEALPLEGRPVEWLQPEELIERAATFGPDIRRALNAAEAL